MKGVSPLDTIMCGFGQVGIEKIILFSPANLINKRVYTVQIKYSLDCQRETITVLLDYRFLTIDFNVEMLHYIVCTVIE